MRRRSSVLREVETLCRLMGWDLMETIASTRSKPRYWVGKWQGKQNVYLIQGVADLPIRTLHRMLLAWIKSPAFRNREGADAPDR